MKKVNKFNQKKLAGLKRRAPQEGNDTSGPAG
jgi:hypothetical protein